MHVLAFRHVPFEGAGRLEKALAARAIELEYVDLYSNNTQAPRVTDAAGLIFLGGPMSVNDPLPHLETEMQLIRDAIARTQPVLGICLGAQLIAKALGARVYRNPAKEIGWFDLHFTEAARDDALFNGVAETETVFHWHSETFDLPPRATLLASSELCRNQAFCIGDTVFGMQFHLEVMPDMIADWCTQDENCGDVAELDSPIDPDRNAERLTYLSDLIFGHWCELLVSSQSRARSH